VLLPFLQTLFSLAIYATLFLPVISCNTIFLYNSLVIPCNIISFLPFFVMLLFPLYASQFLVTLFSPCKSLPTVFSLVILLQHHFSSNDCLQHCFPLHFPAVLFPLAVFCNVIFLWFLMIILSLAIPDNINFPCNIFSLYVLFVIPCEVICFLQFTCDSLATPFPLCLLGRSFLFVISDCHRGNLWVLKHVQHCTTKLTTLNT